MDREASRFHGAMAVLAPPRRFELLLLLLARADRSVSQLAAAVRLSQSCTTRHLQALERAGLVKRVRDGKRVVFQPAPRDATAEAVLGSLSGDRVAPARAGARRPAAGPKAAGRKPPATRRARATRLGKTPTPPAAPAARSRARRGESAAPVTNDSPPAKESGNSSAPASEPASVPAWRRSDLEDYLL